MNADTTRQVERAESRQTRAKMPETSTDIILKTKAKDKSLCAASTEGKETQVRRATHLGISIEVNAFIDLRPPLKALIAVVHFS